MSSPTTFEFKSAFLSVAALVLKSADLDQLQRELVAQMAANPGFFDNDPILIDLDAVRESDAAIDFDRLSEILVQHNTLPVAVRSGSAQQHEQALAAGLAIAPDELPVRSAPRTAEPAAHEPAEPAAPAPSADDAQPAAMPQALPTVVVNRPLRSGQQVYARGADLIVLEAVNFGAEVIADGNIHVYAPLRGRAIAGAHGNTEARIFTTCMEAQLISIAGFYRTAEKDLPAEVAGKPARVRLDGARLVIEPLS